MSPRRRRCGRSAVSWSFARGEPVSEADVLADIVKRDERDMSRPVAPLKQASDAHLLDTTDMNADAVFQAAVTLIAGLR